MHGISSKMCDTIRAVEPKEKVRSLSYSSSENKGAHHLYYCTADLRLCFRLCIFQGLPHLNVRS